ncbi:tRNA G18 (ribose-2'-O)-methylase SpoU (SpoU) (PDB:1GZ0) [Commensalibacter communis]|nr:tRNA G18 (ribose-2'-O)-methylase SpoU (SpoU) (PDB:1GZ0) [Commensalibacter communis]
MDDNINHDQSNHDKPVENKKKNVRIRADKIKPFRCKNLIAVIERPKLLENIGSVIRNANAFGVEKVYIIDPNKNIAEDWQELRERKKLSDYSVSAVKWTFVKRFDDTDQCFDHLEKNSFNSAVTSPHIKGKTNILLDEGDYTIDHKLAVWFGTESCGISERAIERSSYCINVPMFGMIESLNLGTCSGIVLYEVTKQRRAYQSMYKRRNQRVKRKEPLPKVISPE